MAIREARRAVELEPESQNAFHGAAQWAANLALVYALIGEQDQAITLIERLLSTPGAVHRPGFSAEHHARRAASALGVGFAPQQSALPEDSRRTGAEDCSNKHIISATLQIPSKLNYGKLRLHPLWDPFRGDPRFERSVASFAPKSANK